MKKQPIARTFSRSARLAGLAIGLLAATMSVAAFAADKTPRVVGGANTDITEVPWQAALVFSTSAPFSVGCGGSIIHERWILTAAHCKPDSVDFPVIAVMVGASDLTDTSEAQVIPIKRFYAHEKFVNVNEADEEGEYELDYDVALVELETPIDFAACGTRCAKIDLVTSNNESDLAPASAPASVSGWGSTSQDLGNRVFPDILQRADVEIMDCTSSPSLFTSNEITPRMICASSGDFSRDACVGDSGGPLVVPNNSGTGYLQAGIVSWGTEEGCAVTGLPGVYSRVSKFSGWIWDTTDGACCTEPVIDDPLNELIDSDGGGGNGGALTLSLLASLPLLRLAFRRRGVRK